MALPFLLDGVNVDSVIASLVVWPRARGSGAGKYSKKYFVVVCSLLRITIALTLFKTKLCDYLCSIYALKSLTEKFHTLFKPQINACFRPSSVLVASSDKRQRQCLYVFSSFDSF